MPDGSGESELAQMGPVARMMISVAGQAITGYVQFRALAELLIAKGVITRDELEGRFAAMREQELERTIDEWFPADIAYHLKMAIQAAQAAEAAETAETEGQPGGAGERAPGTQDEGP
jgi:hypothetical protein